MFSFFNKFFKKQQVKEEVKVIEKIEFDLEDMSTISFPGGFGWPPNNYSYPATGYSYSSGTLITNVPCPFCKSISCQSYSDLRALYQASYLYEISNYPTFGLLEIHFNSGVVYTYEKDILIARYGFTDGDYNYGIRQHYFAKEGQAEIEYDKAEALISIESIKTLASDASL
jgi:hypothetical protein